MEIKEVSFSRRLGKFNFANASEEGALMVVGFTIDETRHSVSTVVEPYSRFDYQDDDISEAMEHIANHVESLLFSTSRERDREVIKTFRENEAAIRRKYAECLAVRYQKLAARNAKLARLYLDEAMERPEPVSQAA